MLNIRQLNVEHGGKNRQVFWPIIHKYCENFKSKIILRCKEDFVVGVWEICQNIMKLEENSAVCSISMHI